jgi:hypothetical protein
MARLDRALSQVAVVDRWGGSLECVAGVSRQGGSLDALPPPPQGRRVPGKSFAWVGLVAGLGRCIASRNSPETSLNSDVTTGVDTLQFRGAHAFQQNAMR